MNSKEYNKRFEVEYFRVVRVNQAGEVGRDIQAKFVIGTNTFDFFAGEVDAHIRIWARDVDHLRDILYNKLSVLPAHRSTNSTIVLKRWRKPLGLGT